MKPFTDCCEDTPNLKDIISVENYKQLILNYLKEEEIILEPFIKANILTCPTIDCIDKNLLNSKEFLKILIKELKEIKNEIKNGIK
ncbi:MAG: hypothetical protein QXI58_00215 [Candidatus Micrarchaeia archaeon]